MQGKFWRRFSGDEGFIRNVEDETGRIFVNKYDVQDLSGVNILHSGVDTVRQLYFGLLNPGFQGMAKDPAYGEVMDLCGIPFMVHGGGGSGFRLRLQNNEIGLVLLLGNTKKKLEHAGSHLKIECGPQFLLCREADEASHFLSQLANELLNEGWTHNFFETHFCADVQGWMPSKTFEFDVKSRIRFKSKFEGIQRLEFDDETPVKVYGDRETFTWGSRNGLQFQVYRKDLANKKFDKEAFWKKVWNQAHDEDGVCLYNENRPVWRLEVRYHSKTMREVMAGYGREIKDFGESAHLFDDLWRYGLEKFREDYSLEKITPFWQLLYQEVKIVDGKHRWAVKRSYSKGFSSNEARNVLMAVANALSIYARRGVKVKKVIEDLKKIRIWRLFCRYCSDRNVDPRQWITDGLNNRILAGNSL